MISILEFLVLKLTSFFCFHRDTVLIQFLIKKTQHLFLLPNIMSPQLSLISSNKSFLTVFQN